ncbi:hypothetical protein [Novosphingobium sp. 9U]|uniref:hypothetical protein n=1 Tax=Novosphingobium sp. 9U TaxID=2653158 RepID=UPI0012F352F4|nr:hypothetical protein [Novosphingobium sp. 9U]VWX53790.1 conserved hypothetical protein [Novosphingobium sp. 9U]
MRETLAARVEAALGRPVIPEVRAFAERLVNPEAQGVLFYGSNLRTGLTEGVLDFYVLTTGPIERGIWPRVSYHEWERDGTVLRAKVATMTLATFAAAAAGQLIDTTIWARFVQPSALAWSRDDASALAIRDAFAQAARTAARLAVALGPEEGTADAYWRALFRATYAAEFRIERGGREESILAANAAHFDGLLPLALEAQGVAFARDADGTLRPALAPARRAALLRWWQRRQRLGKPYNLVRLVRASTTFEGAARYGAWKIERHTGIPVKLTPWREKHPVLAAPAVLWQVWRARQAER